MTISGNMSTNNCSRRPASCTFLSVIMYHYTELDKPWGEKIHFPPRTVYVELPVSVGC